MSERDFLAARSRVAIDKPYFATALWALKFVEVENLIERYKVAGPVAVDKHWRVYFDPEEIAEWTIEQKMGVLVHELTHVLRRHDKRAALHGIGPENFSPWNVAADAEINDDILRDHLLALPLDPVTPSKLHCPNDLTAEEYYDRLPKIGVKCNCGSGAHGVPQAWEQVESEGRAKIEEHEAETIARATAQRILDEKSQGNVPGDWVRWAEGYANPRVDWRRELAASIRRYAGDVRGLVDYTYRVPSRRQSAYGKVVMPAMVKPDPRVAIVVDTSGSMAKDDLSMALGEIKGILAAIGNRTARYYAVDAEVHVAKTISSTYQVAFKGGGGTSMPVGIRRAVEDRPKPDLVVVITDGYSSWSIEQPSARVIICVVGNDGSGIDFPSWAKVIPVETA